MMQGFKKIVVPKEPELVAPVATTAEDVTGLLDQDCAEVAPIPSAHLPELTSQFLLAGKAIYTVSNPKKEHYTFKVRRVDSEWPQGSGKMSTTYFVSVKAEGGIYPYRYIGLLDPVKGTIKCTAKSEFVPGSKEYDVASWSAMSVLGSKLIPAGYHIEHAGRCGRCGLTLTDPLSIERGIGPECWTTMGSVANAVPGAWGMFDARWMGQGPDALARTGWDGLPNGRPAPLREEVV